jgi:hypothetical protein
VRSLLKTKGGICDSWQRLVLIRAGAERVSWQGETAASCRGKSLFANMRNYNMDVNSLQLCTSEYSNADVFERKTLPSPAARAGHPKNPSAQRFGHAAHHSFGETDLVTGDVLYGGPRC